jgi:gliding motility-associated-like protein
MFLDQYGYPLNVEYHMGTLRIYTTPEIEEINDHQVCQGDSITIHPNISGGSGENTYEWTGPAGFHSDESTLKITNLQTSQSGQYNLIVYDTLDCDDQQSFHLEVIPSPEISFAGQDTLYVEPGYKLHAGTGYLSYRWNTGAQTESITIDSTGQYTVEVISYDGCIATETIYIEWSDLNIYVPNAFTPNSDGLNDIFMPRTRYESIRNYRMYIFSRWGEQVFESSNILTGWDGTYKGKPAMGGVYVYKIDYSVAGQQTKSKTITGAVVLIR